MRNSRGAAFEAESTPRSLVQANISRMDLMASSVTNPIHSPALLSRSSGGGEAARFTREPLMGEMDDWNVGLTSLNRSVPTDPINVHNEAEVARKVLSESMSGARLRKGIDVPVPKPDGDEPVQSRNGAAATAQPVKRAEEPAAGIEDDQPEEEGKAPSPEEGAPPKDETPPPAAEGAASPDEEEESPPSDDDEKPPEAVVMDTGKWKEVIKAVLTIMGKHKILHIAGRTFKSISAKRQIPLMGQYFQTVKMFDLTTKLTYEGTEEGVMKNGSIPLHILAVAALLKGDDADLVVFDTILKAWEGIKAVAKEHVEGDEDDANEILISSLNVHVQTTCKKYHMLLYMTNEYGLLPARIQRIEGWMEHLKDMVIEDARMISMQSEIDLHRAMLDTEEPRRTRQS